MATDGRDLQCPCGAPFPGRRELARHLHALHQLTVPRALLLAVRAQDGLPITAADLAQKTVSGPEATEDAQDDAPPVGRPPAPARSSPTPGTEPRRRCGYCHRPPEAHAPACPRRDGSCGLCSRAAGGRCVRHGGPGSKAGVSLERLVAKRWELQRRLDQLDAEIARRKALRPGPAPEPAGEPRRRA